MRETFSVKRISPQFKEKVTNTLKGEIETFSDWANGDVYGIRLFNSYQDYLNGNDPESCRGFYLDKDYDFNQAILDHYSEEIVGQFDDSVAA